jgi:hypothetical protein
MKITRPLARILSTTAPYCKNFAYETGKDEAKGEKCMVTTG